MTSAYLMAAEDATGSVTTVSIAAVAAVLGAIITGGTALVAARLNSRRQAQVAERQLAEERFKTLRQEKRESYAHYMSAWNLLMREVEKLQADVAAHSTASPQVDDAVGSAYGGWRQELDVVFLLAGPEVIAAAERHLDATEQQLAAARQGNPSTGQGTYTVLNDAMRKELELPDR